MRRAALLALLALVAAVPAAARAAAPPGHAGRWITDSRGRVLILHGLNMVLKRPPYTPAATGFGSDDASFLAAHGFRVVRLGVIYAAVEPSPGVYDDAYLRSIAQTVRTLGRAGVLSLLDFHQDQFNERFHGEGFPAWAVQDGGLPDGPDRGFPANYTSMPSLQHAFDAFWTNSPGPGGVGLATRYASAWGHVARAFRGSADVLGYDLFNEPWPGTNWQPCATAAGCPDFDRRLAAVERASIAAIRAADDRHLVFYEPNVTFNFAQPTHLPDLGDPRLGMSFHDYCSAATGCGPTERRVLANARGHSARTGDALLLTEYGSVDDLTALRRMAGEADGSQMGWTEWAYCGCDDPTGAVPPSNEALVLDPARAPSGGNVKAAKLRALERPHPMAIAGTPRAYRYDVARRRFTLSYATRRPSGRGRFGAGARTTVWLPTRRRWRVRVAGARVVSRPGARVLVLAAKAGARRVALRVS
jgi:endoglycosylceramidase